MAYMNLKTFEIWADSNIDGFENEHFEVDELIAPVIRELNLKGYTTKFCCSGHPYYMFNEAFTKTEKDATTIVGLIDTERCEDANFSVRALYIMPDNDLYIVFAGVSSNDFCLPLPDGFRWDDECTIRYDYIETEVYEFLSERLNACKTLYEWAMKLPIKK